MAYLKRLLRHRRDWKDVVVISRDVYSLLPAIWLRRITGDGPRIIYWAHEVKPDNERYRWTYDHVDGVIGTNSAIADDLHTLCGIPRERLAITLNPISTRQVKLPVDKQTARQRLNLNGKPLVVYTGKLGPGMHEIDYILQAAARLPGYMFLFTGGKPEHVEHYNEICRERGITNAVFTGFLDNYTDVFLYQIAADALVSYYTTQNHLVDYNYPQKITEYMLAGNPIVTPDYRATRDILTEDNAMFVQPEDAANLAQGISAVIEDRTLGARLGERAREDATEITFKARTRMLMDFFKTL
jgi:glycosyltransferase involved in cell wall biosynthesis